MITIIFFVLALGIGILAHTEEYLIYSIILSILLLGGFVSYNICTGYYNPLNDLKTSEIKNNYNNYVNSEKRIEFVTLIEAKAIKQNKDGLLLVKTKLFNGETYFGKPKSYQDEIANQTLVAYAWVSKNSSLWKTFLNNDVNNIAINCKLKIQTDGIILKEINPASLSILNTSYILTYRLMNSFSSQTTSGIVAVTVQVIVLIIIIFLIFIGKSFITFE